MIDRRACQHLRSDVLVIGAGLAGLFAAIRARQLGAEVILVDKGKAGKTGCSRFASGDIKCFIPEEDDLADWIDEIVVAGEYLADQRWIETALVESLDRVRDMEEFGVEFEKKDGKYKREHGRGRRSRQVVFYAEQMMDSMRAFAERIGVKVLDRAYFCQLAQDQGRVVGALGLHTRTGEMLVTAAPAVVLATGSCSLRAAYYGHQFSTGDAYSMAYEVGAELINFECTSHNSCPARYDLAGMSRFVAFGGKFTNAKGEAFMAKYQPVLKDRAQLNWLVRAMGEEVRQGNGPIYFDLKAMTDEQYALSRKIVPWVFRALDRAGEDLRKERIEWIPAFAGTRSAAAGIRTDIDGRTAIPGLLATGDAGSWLTHGFGSGFGGLNLTACIVFGYRAGAAAAEAARVGGVNVPAAEIARLQERVARIEDPAGQETTESLLLKIQRCIVPYDTVISREGGRLQKALDQIERIRDEDAQQIHAPDVHELIKALETQHMLFYAETFLRSALLRTETRGMHFREDFPQRDDENWLKWIVARKGDGQMHLRTEPMPPEAFKYVPPPKKRE